MKPRLFTEQIMKAYLQPPSQYTSSLSVICPQDVDITGALTRVDKQMCSSSLELSKKLHKCRFQSISFIDLVWNIKQ